MPVCLEGSSSGSFAARAKEIIKVMRHLAKPFWVSKGKDFRLKDVDPNNTREFTKEADKARAKEALANGVTAEMREQP
jgi:hypothetical protein